MQTKTIAVLAAVAGASVLGTQAHATPPERPASPFGGTSAQRVHTGGFEVNLGGGSLRQVRCAPGAQPGATCYLGR